MNAAAEVNSGHKAEVFRVGEIKKHPGADRLELTVFAGFQTVTKKGEYKPGDLAVFIPPDSIVNIRHSPFSFLADRAKQDGSVRIKAIRLRGEPSFGLVVPAPEGAKEGEDLAGLWGIEHYNPQLPGESNKDRWALGGECEAAPPGYDLPKYDLENFRRYGKDVFEEGEPCIVQEKADGASSRYLYLDGRYYCGSRTTWKKEFPDYKHITVANLVGQGCSPEEAAEVVERVHSRPKKMNQWWQALRQCPELERFLMDHPGAVVYAELYGRINCIHYDFPEVNRLGAFDLWDNGFVDMQQALNVLSSNDVPLAPVLNTWTVKGGYWANPIPFSFDRICEMAEGPTMAQGAKGGTIREGVVVSSVRERRHPKVGRAKLKCVGVGFSEKYR